ncbi:MAG TPA: lipopolysaccharide biosynthesis protein [Terriglobales bacterium]|nr:lipopolysaccharide biosynthesis protein [Terriglobales bacterium]
MTHANAGHPEVPIQDLKHRAIRGAFAKICSQGTNFALRIGSLMVLSRLLEPRDFGLVGMVTAVTGIFDLFKDFGLSTAAVQRAKITQEQHSTLFWVNILVGGVLGLLVLASAPMIARFYHEPRLFAVTAVLATGFLANASGVQHGAFLQRHLRFTTLAIIEIIALVISIAVAIGMALRGYGYWALVGMAISQPLVSTSLLWVASGWLPGIPRRGVDLVSMLRFGGTITLNGLVVYLAYNLEKVLLGRYWGAAALGIYGRAYQLVNIPTSNLNSAAGGVAFAALSRLQNDPLRFKNYFLKGYSLVLALTIPITLLCALFADDIILVLLGPKWNGTGAIFRLLAPTILIFALINPLAWLLLSMGMVGRSLKIAMVLAPVVIFGYVVGLPHGPVGVAVGYSAMMTFWVLPHIAWCVRDTVVSFRDIVVVLSRPLFSGLIAAIGPFVLLILYGHFASPLARLLVGASLFVGVYLAMLLVVMKQKDLYVDVLRGFKRSPIGEKSLVSA